MMSDRDRMWVEKQTSMMLPQYYSDKEAAKAKFVAAKMFKLNSDTTRKSGHAHYMYGNSADILNRLKEKRLHDLKVERNIRIFFGIIPEPGYLRIPYDIILMIDRVLFGKDSSYRRRVFGMTPWPMKPFYRLYDWQHSRWVEKQPLDPKWMEVK